jgi:hypothetical protein
VISVGGTGLLKSCQRKYNTTTELYGSMTKMSMSVFCAVASRGQRFGDTSCVHLQDCLDVERDIITCHAQLCVQDEKGLKTVDFEAVVSACQDSNLLGYCVLQSFGCRATPRLKGDVC